ncbi:helix-turn-helix transcriptional regulator [Mucilaginibacter sp. HC2]|uniref:winged helix-turn-helix transcriptional regulator n=1 Tax=Mucilaginibacter inviolabilis TaxID=2714892 RepID=UPI001409D791|nr:helix-turn-helix domain-containing protein [Mucilaginibacter inviolabilis]NHA05894.1 helix-turn-helix transcriptional regulator [Mucilaginibacter inviolabilis]
MSTELKPGTSNACNITALSLACEVNDVLRDISPRWKMQILHKIAAGVGQFSTLKHAFPSLSDQILGKRLGELVSDELILKMIIKEKPPQRINYYISDKGLELLKVIDDLHKWGLKWSLSADGGEEK